MMRRLFFVLLGKFAHSLTLENLHTPLHVQAANMEGGGSPFVTEHCHFFFCILVRNILCVISFFA